MKETSGRIPTERLSFADWHKLTKAFDAAKQAVCVPAAPSAEASTPAARDEDAGAWRMEVVGENKGEPPEGWAMFNMRTLWGSVAPEGREALCRIVDEHRALSPSTPPPAEGEVLARLDEIEARANAASEGPWSQGDTEEHGSGRDDAVYLPNDDWLCDPMACVEDAAFIAHARQDIPWLIAQLRARIAGQDAGSRQG
jgi:hypothetical protein